MFKLGNFNSIKETCKDQEIPFFQVSTVNSKHAHFLLKEYDLDLIFNQSQHIVRKTVLDIPRIGVFNRHGALLPRFRGRLAPFWQLYFGEKQGGITYHLLDEKIDNGPIILQEAIPIARGETINSLILKMFRVAIRLFGSVIDFFEQSDFQEHLSPNPESEASYFSTPTIRDAIRYRFRL